MTKPPRLTGPPNPFQTALLLAAALSGMAALLGVSRPNAIEQALPPTLRLTWGVLLFLGGTAALVGQYWRGRPFTGVYVKRAGLIACGGASLAYGLALILLFPRQGVSAGLSNIAFAAACFWRAWQVTKILRVAREYATRHDQEAKAAGGSP